MKKLKNILQYNYIFYVMLIIGILYTIIYINFINIKKIYSVNDNSLYGKVISYKKNDKKVSIVVKGKEKVLVNYYKNINISYGDYIYIKGEFNKPNNNTNFNLFNYRKYLLSNKINYIVKASKINIMKYNNNPFYSLKNILLNRIEKCDKSKGYILAFLYADKSLLEKDIYTKYQNLGISHLFAVSGMHVSLISIVLLKILKRINEIKKYVIISIILLIYLFLTNFTISMVRATFQFILFFINRNLKLKIDNSNLVIFLFVVLLIINPYNIYNIGFQFSFLISFTLIKFSKLFNGNFITKLFETSLISFFVSMPIVINNFFQINFLSIIFNLIYIPFVSYILFPLNLMTIICPFLDSLTYFIIAEFENITNIVSNIKFLTFSVAKMNIIFIFIYYFVFLWIINYKQKIIKKVIIIIVFIVFILNNKYIVNSKVVFLDVGQGDCTLIREKNKNLLIDTGGNINYDISKNILVPYLKSIGIKKIDYLIITHGDYDHIGAAINLIKNYKVENVIFNCGNYNKLEKNLIKVLKKEKTKYYSCIKKLNIHKYKLQFINTGLYDNENDNSNVIYFNYNNYKFLLMGDAGIEVEQDLIEKYNLQNIDVLKVGHHGSKTSSSKSFIDEINPKYSIISVGKNNHYGHPNDSVLENLKNSKIYRTDQDGSIEIKLNKNRYIIKTCVE